MAIARAELLISIAESRGADSEAIADAKEELEKARKQYRDAQSHLVEPQESYPKECCYNEDGDKLSDNISRLNANVEQRRLAINNFEDAYRNSRQVFRILSDSGLSRLEIETRDDPPVNFTRGPSDRIMRGEIKLAYPNTVDEVYVEYVEYRDETRYESFSVPVNYTGPTDNGTSIGEGSTNGTFQFKLSRNASSGVVDVTANLTDGDNATDFTFSPPQDPEVAAGFDHLLWDGDGLSDRFEQQVTKTQPLNTDSDSTRTSSNDADDGVVDGAEDFDEDFLRNRYEYLSDTDPFDEDTDGDSLPDGFEYRYKGIDPTNPDTDEDSVRDDAEDLDGDGLSNIEEYENGTDPSMNDTDTDNISDARELDINTSPRDSDTDGDNLTDGTELRIGTDPLSPDTNGNGIEDSEETYTTKTSNASLNTSVRITGVGDVASGVSIERDSTRILNEGGIETALVSSLVDISSEQQFNEANITLEYNESQVTTTESNLTVVTYNRSRQLLIPLDSSIDTANKTVSATTPHFSVFGVVDSGELQGAYSAVDSGDPTEPIGLNKSFEFIGNWETRGGARTVGNSLIVDGSSTNQSEGPTIIVAKDGTGDYESIQPALDAAPNGATILIDDGMYDEDLYINKSVSLIGNDTTITGDYVQTIEIETDNSSIEIVGINIDPPDSYDDGIEIKGDGLEVKITHSEIRTGSNAIEAALTNGKFKLLNSTISAGDKGVTSDDSANSSWIISNVRFEQSTDAIEERFGENNIWRVNNVQINGAENSGLNVNADDSIWKVTNASISNPGSDAIDTSGTSNSYNYSNVDIQNSGNEAIEIGDDDSELHFQDILVRNSGQEGFQVTTADSSFKLKNIKVISSMNEGIQAGRYQNTWTLENMTIRDTRDQGIRAYGEDSNWSLENVTVASTGDEGLELRGDDSNVSISNTRINDTAEEPLETPLDSDSSFELRQSIITNGGEVGIDSNRSTITDTKIANVEEVEIYSDESSSIKIRDTTIETREEAIRGIQAGNIELSNVRISNATEAIDPSDDITWEITETTITNNFAGIGAKSEPVNSGTWSLQNVKIVDNDATGVTLRGFEGQFSTVDSVVANNTIGTSAVNASGTISITNSQLVENDIHGVNATEASPQVDATNNWWGQSTGPESGQAVGNVTTTPFCPTDTCASTRAEAGADIEPVDEEEIGSSSIDVSGASLDDSIGPDGASSVTVGDSVVTRELSLGTGASINLTTLIRGESRNTSSTAELVVNGESGETTVFSVTNESTSSSVESANLTQYSGENITIEFRASPGSKLVVGNLNIDGSLDSDRDGLNNWREIRGFTTGSTSEVTTSPYIADTDGDGLSDSEEIGERRTDIDLGMYTVDEYYKLNSSPDSFDTDGDGLPDRLELTNQTVKVIDSRSNAVDYIQAISSNESGFEYLTTYNTTSSPLYEDTDKDGLNDTTELRIATDPRKADTDGDTARDDLEKQRRSDPSIFDTRAPQIDIYQDYYYTPQTSQDSEYGVVYGVEDSSRASSSKVIKDEAVRTSTSYPGYPVDPETVNSEFEVGAIDTTITALGGTTVSVRSTDRHGNTNETVAIRRQNFYSEVGEGLARGYGSNSTVLALKTGQLSGFTTGAGGTAKELRAAARDPVGYVKSITQLVELLRDLGLLEEIIRALPQQIEQKQELNNPYDQSTSSEEYQAYRAGWYEGYGGFFVVKQLAGGQASAAAKNSKKLNKLVDKIDRSGKLRKSARYYRGAKSKATSPVRRAGLVSASKVAARTDVSEGAAKRIIAEGDTVGEQALLANRLRKVDGQKLDNLDSDQLSATGKLLRYRRGGEVNQLDKEAIDQLTGLNTDPVTRARLSPTYAELDSTRRQRVTQYIESSDSGGDQLVAGLEPETARKVFTPECSSGTASLQTVGAGGANRPHSVGSPTLATVCEYDSEFIEAVAEANGGKVDQNRFFERFEDKIDPQDKAGFQEGVKSLDEANRQELIIITSAVDETEVEVENIGKGVRKLHESDAGDIDELYSYDADQGPAVRASVLYAVGNPRAGDITPERAYRFAEGAEDARSNQDILDIENSLEDDLTGGNPSVINKDSRSSVKGGMYETYVVNERIDSYERIRVGNKKETPDYDDLTSDEIDQIIEEIDIEGGDKGTSDLSRNDKERLIKNALGNNDGKMTEFDLLAEDDTYIEAKSGNINREDLLDKLIRYKAHQLVEGDNSLSSDANMEVIGRPGKFYDKNGNPRKVQKFIDNSNGISSDTEEWDT
jgi:hypothetical protein